MKKDKINLEVGTYGRVYNGKSGEMRVATVVVTPNNVESDSPVVVIEDRGEISIPIFNVDKKYADSLIKSLPGMENIIPKTITDRIILLTERGLI